MHIHFSKAEQQQAALLNGQAANPSKADPKALAPEGELPESSTGRGFTTIDEARISPEARQAADRYDAAEADRTGADERSGAPADAGPRADADARVRQRLEDARARAEERQADEAARRREAAREEREAERPDLQRQTELREGRNPAETLEIARRVFREALAPKSDAHPDVDLAQRASSQIRAELRDETGLRRAQYADRDALA